MFHRSDLSRSIVGSFGSVAVATLFLIAPARPAMTGLVA